MTGQAGIFRHRLHWIFRVDNKKIQRKKSGRWNWSELSFGAGKIKTSQRLMNEHRPTGCANQPLNGNAPAVGPQTVAALTAAHIVGIAAAIKLRPAFAQS